MSGVVTAANSVLAVPVAYLGALTIVAASARADSPTRPTYGQQPATRFAVLVPAHDEETTIGVMLASMADQRYPKSLFSVYVVADNCEDATARVATEFGVTTFERFDDGDRGKGPALNWLLTRVSESGEAYDVIVFIDADTTVDPEFLMALDRRFQDGACVVQGSYGVRDAFESTPGALRYSALACRHHLRPLGRTALGASCGLFGNGMAFRGDVIFDRPWSSHLVEDLALQVELLLAGTTVGYEPSAKIEAEMPNTFAGSVTQHQRWERGRMQVLRRYAPSLVRRLIEPRGVPRIAIADTLADLAVPPLSLLAAATSISAGSAAILAAARPTRLRLANLVVGTTLVVVVVAHVLTALRLTHAPRAAYRALAQGPKLVAWKIMILMRLKRKGDDNHWIRTRRNTENPSD